MKVLIIKISSMGDIIHTLPAVTDALHAIPNITFTWVVEETFSDIVTWHPAIYKIIPITLRIWKKNWYKFCSWNQYYKWIKQLKEKYDIIIDAQGLLKTSFLITRLSCGKKHGMNYTSAREPISSWFYHQKHYIHKQQHAIERIRQLFSLSLKYSIPTKIGKYGINHLFPRKKSKIPCLIFFHSTSQEQKNWPEYYWYIITQYAIKSGYHIKLPFWTKTEELRAKKLETLCSNKITILPNLKLQDIANEIAQSTAAISVDTGLSHLAAALDCPNLTLYGPTNPTLIGTYGRNQIILHSPTKKMHHLKPMNVWTTFQNKLTF